MVMHACFRKALARRTVGTSAVQRKRAEGQPSNSTRGVDDSSNCQDWQEMEQPSNSSMVASLGLRLSDRQRERKIDRERERGRGREREREILILGVVVADVAGGERSRLLQCIAYSPSGCETEALHCDEIENDLRESSSLWKPRSEVLPSMQRKLWDPKTPRTTPVSPNCRSLGSTTGRSS